MNKINESLKMIGLKDWHIDITTNKKYKIIYEDEIPYLINSLELGKAYKDFVINMEINWENYDKIMELENWEFWEKKESEKE